MSVAASTRPLYRVVVRAHTVRSHSRTWEVPNRELRLGGPDEGYAVERAIRSAHYDAGIPQLRSLARQSAPFVEAALTER